METFESEIVFPSRLTTRDEKIEYFKEIQDWARDNLEDLEYWNKYVVGWQLRTIKSTTSKISFNMRSETDAFAVKLTWCGE